MSSCQTIRCRGLVGCGRWSSRGNWPPISLLSLYPALSGRRTQLPRLKTEPWILLLKTTSCDLARQFKMRWLVHAISSRDMGTRCDMARAVKLVGSPGCRGSGQSRSALLFTLKEGPEGHG